LDQGGKRSKNDLFGDQAKSMKKSKSKANKRLERSQQKSLRKKKQQGGKED
jgi:hypothetical protein